MMNNGAYFSPPTISKVNLTLRDEKALMHGWDWTVNIDDTTLAIAVKDILYLTSEGQWPVDSIIHNLVTWLMTFDSYYQMSRSTVLDIVQVGVMEESARRFANNIILKENKTNETK